MNATFGAVFAMLIPILIVAALALYMRWPLEWALAAIAVIIVIRLALTPMFRNAPKGFDRFNKFFGNLSADYSAGVTGSLKRKPLILLVYVLMLCAAYIVFNRVPAGFVPVQDKQYLVSLRPAAATARRSTARKKSYATCRISRSKERRASKTPSRFRACRSTASLIQLLGRHRLCRAEAV